MASLAWAQDGGPNATAAAAFASGNGGQVNTSAEGGAAGPFTVPGPLEPAFLTLVSSDPTEAVFTPAPPRQSTSWPVNYLHLHLHQGKRPVRSSVT